MNLRNFPSRILVATVLFSAILALGQESGTQHQQCPHQAAKPASSQSEHANMMARGEKGMGFSQTSTTHHFLLKPDGGVIAVTANDPKDTATRDQIRAHLAHISHAFAEGNFEIPMFVHDQVPPGIDGMKRRASDIQYEFHNTEHGGEVAITSTSAEATLAIHDFLIFQIREHKTGDAVALP